ncbi:phosphoribosylformylglycinamidine synthase subunit PurS [Geochorda subterranea]|uniref:Phosphoribosylformylglycinamidine synthase subunit PurS n=1 Tax=Geochorda subterranea TaxID=3109564 RepID=A0ABZ1BQX4_9FIRM|nr:phosphoribosylformylglycinamidine synthase subunit PurS [Limnochorda sp. LNt]WRP14915.1 phosphoribosylformylglycinamidine synthase subunit PurS [Limnochorda sp. LNt]
MARFTVFVHVMPRQGVLDPPGEATRSALQALGFPGVLEVRIGRRIALDLEADSRDEALERARAMAERLLANPVIESFEVRAEQP